MRAILAEPGYAAIKAESDYFRLGYILERLNKPEGQRWWIALQATWQVDSKPDKHRTYQERFLTIVNGALTKHGTQDAEWWAMQAFAANAERQLGRFGAAKNRIGKLPLASIPEDQAGWRDQLNLVSTLAQKRNAEIEPDEALPPMVKGQRERGVEHWSNREPS